MPFDLTLLIHLGVIICIYATLAISLNMILGVTGLFTIGHAAFFGSEPIPRRC
jgi:branched-chain amino acid transport system permease protein